MHKDFFAGLLFLAFGWGAMYIADRDYPMGTVMRMGPGNFPLWLGWVLAGFGVFLAARGIWHIVRGTPRSGAAPPEKEPGLDFVQGDRAPAPAPLAWTWPEAASGWRAMACIVASMLVFGYLMPRLGLVPALVPMFFIAAFGGREFRWREVTVLTLVMTALAVGVFVVLLKLPFQLVRGFYLV